MVGHGWVVPNEDGSVARCGGPACCSECALEAKSMSISKPKIHYDHQLTKPTKEEYAQAVEMAEALVNQHAIQDTRMVNLALSFLMLHDSSDPKQSSPRK